MKESCDFTQYDEDERVFGCVSPMGHDGDHDMQVDEEATRVAEQDRKVEETNRRYWEAREDAP